MDRLEHEAIIKARLKAKSLLEVANKRLYNATFANYNYEDQTPVSPEFMGNVNKEHVVVMTEEVDASLRRIRDITEQTNCEVAFFVLGEELPSGVVSLDQVLSTYQPSSREEADFSNLDPYLNEYVKNIQKSIREGEISKKPIICHGHTHGTGLYSDNFSLWDLMSYIRMTNAYPLFKDREIETMGVVLPLCGDYNFIMYENNRAAEGFYKFPSVYVLHNDGNLTNLPAYQNGNYLSKDAILR